MLLNISQINGEKSIDRSTRNNVMIPPHLRVRMENSDERPHPLYTSILGSKKTSSKSILLCRISIDLHNSQSQGKYKGAHETIKKIRQRVKAMIKEKKGGFRDRRMKSVVDT